MPPESLPLRHDLDSSTTPTQPQTNKRTSLRPFLLSSPRPKWSPTLPRTPSSTPALVQEANANPLPPLYAPEIIVSPVDESSPRLIHPAFRHSQRWPSLRGERQHGDDGLVATARGDVNEAKEVRVQTPEARVNDEARSPVSPVRASVDEAVGRHERRERAESTREVEGERIAVRFARRASSSSQAREDAGQQQQQQQHHAYRSLPYPLSPTSPIPPPQRFESAEKRGKESPPQFEAWSPRPSHLEQRSKFAIAFAIGDAILAFAPVAFIILGICVAKLHGQEVEGNGFGKNIERTMNLGPTVFPIMFAAVTGKALKTTARYCAERGAKLGTLELLMASQTVWGTFESQVLLKSLTVVGAHLFFLWALSPLGGQASLRVLGSGSMAISNQSQIVFMSTGNMSPLQDTNTALAVRSQDSASKAALNTMYNAIMLAPDGAASNHMDFWGNPRVPRIDTLDQSSLDSDGWLSVPDSMLPSQFSALVGIPVVGVLPVDQAEFELTSSYLELSCPWQNKLPDPQNHSIPLNETLPLGKIWGPGGVLDSADLFGDLTKGTQTSFYLDTDTEFTDARMAAINFNPDSPDPGAPLDLNDPSLREPRMITFGSRYWSKDDKTTYTILRWCTVTTRYVDAAFQCDSGSCAAKRVRASPKYDGRNKNITVLDWNLVTGNLFEQLPRSSGNMHIGYDDDGTLTEKYIQGAFGVQNVIKSQMVKMMDVTMDDFNDRFTRLINTYLHLAQAPVAFAGSTASVSDFGPFGNSTYGNGTEMQPALLGNTNGRGTAPWLGFPSTATNKTFRRVYQCDFLWLALMEASSGILLCLGIAGLVMKTRCRAPDMLGFVTSMTYDNPYVVLPPGGCVFSAMERAQRLKALEVRIGDVQPSAKQGHVAFASVGGNAGIGSLQKDRLYV